MSAKSVIIATGARYNRLPLARLSEFEGVGVYYAATQVEAQACAGRPAVIVGGGNSAGQAALFLARTCTQVHIVIRGDTLATSMSRYLVDQIERSPQIRVSPRTEVISLLGAKQLEGVELREATQEQTSTEETCGLFVFIGAKPSTEWLDGQLAQDDRGFLLTGADIPISQRHGIEPLVLETSRPGVFCVGDVRSRSIKRVAAAIGEGSMAVRVVFDRVQTNGAALASPTRTAG
jgi:thioredoxin reductase (NADPH)